MVDRCVLCPADVLAQALVPEGYSCFFRAKKPSPATKFGFPADGIALFYRHSRFSCSPAPAGMGMPLCGLHAGVNGRSVLDKVLYKGVVQQAAWSCDAHTGWVCH